LKASFQAPRRCTFAQHPHDFSSLLSVGLRTSVLFSIYRFIRTNKSPTVVLTISAPGNPFLAFPIRSLEDGPLGQFFIIQLFLVEEFATFPLFSFADFGVRL
jgi:hypothetical protein